MAAIYDTPEALAKLSEPDLEFAELLATTPQPKIELSHPVVLAIRQQTLAAEEKRTASALATGKYNEETLLIPMRDNHQSLVRIHHAPDPSKPSPLIILIHGGGFIFGHPLQSAPTARHLTILHNTTVACISYRLAPEHPWPQAHRDAWDSVVWLSSRAAELGADLKAGFVVGGASAGGNLAAVVAQKALEGEALAAKITGVWMDGSMVFKGPEYVPAPYRGLHLSHDQNADAPGLLSAQAIEYIRSAVKGDGRSGDFSPANSERAGEGWPRVFLQVAGMDPFRDDGLVWERMLRGRGVETRLRVYAGVPHGFVSLWSGLEKSSEARRDTLEGLGWLLGREVERGVVEDVLNGEGGG